ncbi:MAG: heme-binding protein, partial [Verrucomicrobia bacterium]|nr:heme-binding protein [Verrucomicrobiota bacterium]
MPIIAPGQLNKLAQLLAAICLVTGDGHVFAAENHASQAIEGSKLRVKDGFKAELLYSVPQDKEGSWVNLCTDPKGRLIVSDQYGGLFRITPPAPDRPASDTQVSPIPVDLGEAQGLLWAFDSLYVVVNKGKKYASGLYRVRDTNGDDQLDDVKLLRAIDGGGEHGPHAVVLHPDGKTLVVVCGNHTKPLPFEGSRVPRVWQEDHVITRMWDAGGHAVGVMAPGGWIARTDAEGKSWELLSMGYRNQFDAAYNRDGELFTYDADMEWDMNTPWYRPTRINHATSGSEFGWRSGAGKWPTYYPDSLPSVVDIGPGSPTGISFGYGTKFPARYQDALYICDWSYGKLYAIHLSPSGSTYGGTTEEFITGAPLPLTDVVVNPKDGLLYFTIGGRRTQSGIYRVSYTGGASTAPSTVLKEGRTAREQRRDLEKLHSPQGNDAVSKAWKGLSSSDRFIRFAARTALEHQDPKLWQDKALKSRDARTAINALLGLVRVGDRSLQPRVLAALN